MKTITAYLAGLYQGSEVNAEIHRRAAVWLRENIHVIGGDPVMIKVYSPIEMLHGKIPDEGNFRRLALQFGITLLCLCDVVIVIKENFKKSEGTICEINEAVECFMPIYYLSNVDGYKLLEDL